MLVQGVRTHGDEGNSYVIRLAAWLGPRSHHVVSAGAGGLTGQLRAVLLLSEGLLLAVGATFAPADLAHPVFFIAFLFEARALVYIQTANAHLNP